MVCLDTPLDSKTYTCNEVAKVNEVLPRQNIQEKCWEDGIKGAVTILAKYGITEDFIILFSSKDCDLMRPNGGEYPGVSEEFDRSLLNETVDPNNENT